MSVSQEIWDTFRKLTALEARTEDVVKGLERIQDKVDGLLDRLSRLEAQYSGLRESVRNEILADIKAEVAVIRFALGSPGLSGGSSLLPGDGAP